MIPLSLSRRTLLAGAITFLAAFALYTHTLSPAFHPDDSPETITAGVTLSHQHPPGYPLHSLLGHLAYELEPGGPAFSVNLVAAFFGALAVALAFGCLREGMAELVPWESQAPLMIWGAMGMAVMLACTQMFWFQAGIAKGGVYTLNMALTFGTLLAVLKVRSAGLVCPVEQLRGEGSYGGSGLSCGCPAPAALRLAGLCFGLGMANHWTSQIVLLPAYGVLLAEPRLRRQGWPGVLGVLRIACWPALFAAIAFSLYLYLPFRSHAPLVWGDSQSLSGFWWIFSRSQYAGIEASKTLAVFTGLLRRIGENVVTDFTPWGALVVLGGWVLLFRRQCALALGLLLAPLMLALAVAWKANPPADSYFIIDPYLLPVTLGLGLGLAGWASVSQLRPYLELGFLALALSLGVSHYSLCDHAFDFLGYDYVRNLFLSVPKGAVLFCEGDSNTAGPFYERFVQGHRRDVTLVTDVLSDYEWYRRSLQAQDPSLKLPPQAFGPGGNMAWIAENNPGRPMVWTNSYTKGWVNEAQLLHRGLVLVRQAKAQAAWSPRLLMDNRVWPAYALRGVFAPYQRVQDPITVRLVQDNYVESQSRLAVALAKGGDPKAAALEYRTVGALKPGWAAAWVQAGNAEYQGKDLEAAGNDWKRAVLEEPASAEAQANLGLYFYNRKDYDQSLSQANKALKLNPDLANAHELRNLSLQKLGGAPAAPAPRAAPDGPAYAMKGDQLATQNKPADALAAYDEAVRRGFANAMVHRNRGVMLMQLSRTAEAAEALRQAVAMDPKNAELYRYLGIMLYNSGDRQNGAQAIRTSASLDPKNAETQALLKQMGQQP